MKKNTILYVLLIFLIVVNGFFLYNFLGKDTDNRLIKPQRNKNFIVKELGFNAAQLERFKEGSKGHHETMMRLSNDIKVLKDNLFETLSDDVINESTIDSISALISEKETEKEKEIFYHFRMIRDIANAKQKEKFEKLLMDALRHGDNGNRPPPPNRENGRRPTPVEADGHRPPPRHQ